MTGRQLDNTINVGMWLLVASPLFFIILMVPRYVR